MKIRIAAFLGDYYHPKNLLVQSLNRAIHNMSDEHEIHVEYKTVNQLVDTIETQPDLVILGAENRLNPTETNVKNWMSDWVADSINKYVLNGGGWLAWHSGLASYDEVDDYVGMLRGYFTYHPEKHQLVKYTSNNEVQFEILDEHYFVECNEKDTNVFLRSESIDGHSVAGWTHKYGDGQVVCLTPAHLKEGLIYPKMTDILVKSIKWGCRLEKVNQ